MITVYVYPLAFGAPPLIYMTFAREHDAADYEAMWRRIGCCHLRRTK